MTRHCTAARSKGRATGWVVDKNVKKPCIYRAFFTVKLLRFNKTAPFSSIVIYENV